MAFAAEGAATAVVSPPPVKKGRTMNRRAALTTAALIVVAGAIAALLYLRFIPLDAAERHPGKVTFETQPAGATIAVDGATRGATPLSLSLDPGTHRVTVTNGTDVRETVIAVAPGSDMVRYMEFTPAVPRVALGRVSVVTDPPGARVHVDGQLRGTSPVTVEDLTPKEHKITVSTEAASAERLVTLEAGATTSVVFSLPKSTSPAAGWLAVTAPFDVQIFENDAVIGTGKSSKTMLTAGRHDVDLVNDSLEYRETRRVEVTAGKVTTVKVEPPKVEISANARPWADVLIDGTNVGQTPIAKLPVAVGTHQVVFRHPQLGERTQTVVVTARGPNRIAVDLTK